MAISTFIYQSRFEVNKPPAIPTVFSQAAEARSSARQSVVGGGNFGFVAPRPALAFAASAEFPDFIARNPALLPQGSPSFVFQSPTVVVAPTAFGFSQWPVSFLLPRRPELDSTNYSFVSKFLGVVPATGAFGQYPSIARRGVVRGGNFGFVFIPAQAVAVSFSGFGEFPDLISKPAQGANTAHGFVAPRPPATFANAEFPDFIPLQLRQQLPYAPFVSTIIAKTPAVLGFSQAPEQFKLPTWASLLNVGAPGFVFLPTLAATPTALGFSQWPEQFAQPRKPGLDAYSFVSKFQTVVPATGAFGHYPSIVRRGVVRGGNAGFVAPRQAPIFVASAKFPDFIARNPALLPGSPGFVFLSSTAVATPTAFGFSQWPESFLRPRRVELDAYSFVSGVPTQPVTISFSPSPVAFAKPRDVGLERYSFSFLQIAYTPSAFGFSQQPAAIRLPTLASLLNVGSPGFEFLPTVAVTPTALGFSQWPESFLRPRRPEIDSYSFVSSFRVAITPTGFGFSSSPFALRLPTPAAIILPPGYVAPPPPTVPVVFGQYPAIVIDSFVRSSGVGFGSRPPAVTATPSAFGFSQWPVSFAKPRQPGLDSYSFVSAFRTAVTPAPLGFSQAPEQFRLPAWASLLNTGTPGFVFIPTLAATPGPLGFSQWPEQFARPRQPGLDTYSFVSAFRTAVTPGPLAFYISSDIAAKIAAPLPFVGFVTAQLFAATPGPFGFSASPQPTRAIVTAPLPFVGFVAVPFAFTPTFSQSAEFLPRRIVVAPFQGFVFSPAAITWSFGQSVDPVRRTISLDAGRGFALVPAVATPRPFGFSQHPVAFAKPRMPGLDTYSFVSTFRIAATPFAYGFSPSPEQIKLPTLASLLNAGSLGFVFTPNQTLITVGPIHVIYPHRRPLGHPALDRADEVAAQSRSPNKPAKDRLADDDAAISRSPPNKPAKDRLN